MIIYANIHMYIKKKSITKNPQFVEKKIHEFANNILYFSRSEYNQYN